jgi:pantoate--beta-alanine ligase
MITLTTIAALRKEVAVWRQEHQRIALVPTMGNLHAGHLRLIAAAREQATRVIATIFVNPLQFAAHEDLATYPRTPAEDQAALSAAGCDLLFMPAESEIYPHGRKGLTFVEVPGLSETLCGASRPGHFRGVATVVNLLFNLVQPDVALFGRKDFQQLRVIEQMVADLHLPLQIVAIDTVREVDGLAMSSRNGYLNAPERLLAPQLYQTLTALRQRIVAGERDWLRLEASGIAALSLAGFRPDYLVIRRQSDLQPPQQASEPLIILVAAWLGRTRLIDNLLLSPPEE